MPPWYIDKIIGVQEFKYDYSLSDDEISTLTAWVDSDAPRGNPSDMPPPREFRNIAEWKIGDPAWVDVPAATGCVQTQPDEGQPATERTEVRVLFDNDTIYFGFVCYDRDPDGIITSASRRDASQNNSDSIQIILDTFRDRQSAFVFGTSPAG